MTTRRMFAVLLVAVMSATMAFGQTDGAATSTPAGPNPDQPKASSVYQAIPADCVGFMATTNLKDLLANVEKFSGDIGMGDMLKQVAPGGLLPMMALPLGLGEGYNPNGGIAVVVTDFEKSGFDLAKTIKGEAEPTPSSMPFVLLVAGKSAKTAFPQIAIEKEGKVVIPLPMGMMETKQVGQYIAMSPNPKALALMGAGKSFEVAAPKAHVQALLKSNIAIHYNMVAVSPIIKIVMDQLDEQKKAMEEANGGMMPGRMMMGPMMGLNMFKTVQDILDQVEGVTVTVRVAQTGLMLEELVDYKADSKLGKMVAALKPTAKPLMNRVPNLPYVLAGGMTMTQAESQEAIDASIKMFSSIMEMAGLQLPKDITDRMVKLGTEFSKQVTAIQFVGGAPKASGLFGVGIVIECESAEAVKGLLAQKAEILTDLVQKTLAVKEEDLKSLQFKYSKGVDTVAGVKVDSLEVISDELTTLSEGDKKEMIQVLSEDKIRFMVAGVDPKTVVVTFGGGKEFLAAAIEAAQKGDGVSKDEGVVAAKKQLAPQNVALIVFSGKNLFDTIQAGMKKMEAPSDLPADFGFKGTEPIAVGYTTEDATVKVTVYVPTLLVKDVAKWIMLETMGKAAGPAPAATEAPADDM